MRPALLAAGLAAAVAAPAALLVAWHGFDGLYGQDSFAYVDYALGPLTDTIRRLEAPPPFFWPPGYPLLVALVAAVSGLGAASGQIVSLIAGATVPVLVALLAREVLPAHLRGGHSYVLALLAGLIAALTGQLWQSSVVAMSDTAAVAFATTGAWATCRYIGTGRVWALVLAAAALAFAIETRWIYGLVALPLGLAAVVHIARTRRDRPAAALGHAAIGASVALLVASPTWLPIVAALLEGRPPPFVGDFAVYRWNPLGAAASAFTTADGRLEYALPTGLFYALQPVQHYWFGALGLLAVPGLVSVLRRPSFASTVVLVVWPAAVMGFLLGGGYQNTRFFMAAVPPFAILAAAGAAWLWRTAGSAPQRWRLPAMRVTAAVLMIGLLMNAGLAARFTNGFIERMQRDTQNIRLLAARVPDGARVLSLGATPLLVHDGRHEVAELADLDSDSVMALLSDGRDSYLLVDIESIRRQWADSGPGRAVQSLEHGPGLRQIGRAGIWTLYAIDGRAYHGLLKSALIRGAS